MVNPSVKMDSWFTLLDSFIPPSSVASNQGFRVPSLEARKLIRIALFYNEPQNHIHEIESTYRELCADESRLRRHLSDLGQEAPSALAEPARAKQSKLFYRLQAVHGALLTITIGLNSLLRASSLDNDLLLDEAASLTEVFITLAQHASQYRPLGASYVPPCLAAIVSPFQPANF